jgi:hypothetical protein
VDRGGGGSLSPALRRTRDDPICDENEQEAIETAMTTFDDRERAAEAGYAHDQEMIFRIAARRNRLVGEWAADQMKLTPAEKDAYAKSVVQADFEEAGDEDVIRKLLGDLTAAGVDTDDRQIRSVLEEKTTEAKRQLMEGR